MARTGHTSWSGLGPMRRVNPLLSWSVFECRILTVNAVRSAASVMSSRVRFTNSQHRRKPRKPTVSAAWSILLYCGDRWCGVLIWLHNRCRRGIVIGSRVRSLFGRWLIPRITRHSNVRHVQTNCVNGVWETESRLYVDVAYT